MIRIWLKQLTVVLVAVFIPMSFMSGNVGRLFGEFGISLAAAVIEKPIVKIKNMIRKIWNIDFFFVI